MNAKLLLRGGFIDKLHAGVYTFLPIGLRVLKKIEAIIREEMNAAGGQELFLPSLHPKENWVATGRWESMDDLYKLKDASDREFALGATHEEVVVPLVKSFIRSYRDLPLALYQIQTKFRMELRAKSGLLRGREFLMKDLYSFHADEKDFEAYYERMKEVYRRVFQRSGIGEETFLTLASGGTFSKFSHEFQTLTPAGEDAVYLCRKCNIGINEEISKGQNACSSCDTKLKDLEKVKAIEVGNIFPLKTKFSDAFALTYTDASGAKLPVLMGCYGIGLGRLMAAIAEVHHDDRGLVWPKTVAPFDAHVVALGKDESVFRHALEKAETLQKAGIDVLYDDRTGVSAGEKLSVSDLLGIPVRFVISEKTLRDNKIEAKRRQDEAPEMIPFDSAANFVRNNR